MPGPDATLATPTPAPPQPVVAPTPAGPAPSGPLSAQPSPRSQGSQFGAQLRTQGVQGASAAGPRATAKEKLPSGKEGFEKMWEAHPHNYQEGYEGGSYEQNKSSDQVREEEGLPSYMANTCAIRLSVMLNKLGYKITPAKVAAAGIQRKPTYSAKSKEYYIVAASEMWTYLQKHFRKADQVFPPRGRWKTAEEFDQAWNQGDAPLRNQIASKKGIVAFDKIFGYGGTGHVDIFDGTRLSDAPAWYPSQQIQVWYVAV